MAPDLTNVTWMLRTQWSVTALFFLGSVPSTAAPPTRTRSTLTRVRLAVSGLGGCFCQQSFNERKWNTSPCPLPPSLAQLSVVAGLIGLQSPVIKWKCNFVCVSETTSSFERTIVWPLPLFTSAMNSELTDQILGARFCSTYFLQEKYLGPFTYVLN